MNFPKLTYENIIIDIKTHFDNYCQIPIIYKNNHKMVVDKHFGDDTLCWIDDNDDNQGEPVKINECMIIPQKNIRRLLL